MRGQILLDPREVVKQLPDYVCEVSPAFVDNENLCQFSTVGAANDYAISLLNPVLDFNEAAVIRIYPGFYTEHLTSAHRRCFLEGVGGMELENWPKPAIIWNTGADAEHYPIDAKIGLNLSGVTVRVNPGGIYGEIISRGMSSMCSFEEGHFIRNSNPGTYMSTYFNLCTFAGDAFKLEGANAYSSFVAFRRCDLYDGTDMIFGSTNDGAWTQGVKFQDTMIGSPTAMDGDFSLLMGASEVYGTGKLTFDTDGYVDIFSSTIRNGIHFTTDTAQDKKIVNCIFKDTPGTEGDITADVDIEFIEYSGNHQDHGVDGEVLTVSKIKNVGGGQNNYRNIHEALSGAKLQDAIINLEGDVVVSEPLVINPNIKIQIDGNKKWVLTSTHATTLAEITANQCLSFVNMKAITGGKLVKLNGNSACFTMVSCGRYTHPCYVNIEIAAGDSASFVYLLNTTNRGTSAPVIKIMDVDPGCAIDRSLVVGAVGYPALVFTVDADGILDVKNSTMLHGSGGTNAPLTYAGAGKVDFKMYNCGLNAAYNSADLNNIIGSANNTVDPGITF